MIDLKPSTIYVAAILLAGFAAGIILASVLS